MEIKIYYCSVWNYEPTAASLAEELQKEFNVDAELIPGNNGIFDVVIDDQLIFSRASESRFPEQDEIINKIKTDEPV